jgi:hypothetical protein
MNFNLSLNSEQNNMQVENAKLQRKLAKNQ